MNGNDSIQLMNGAFSTVEDVTVDVSMNLKTVLRTNEKLGRG